MANKKSIRQPLWSLALTGALLLGLLPAPVGAATDNTAPPSVQPVNVAPVAALQDGKRPDFIMGADVSELYAIEQSGKKFYDTDGTEMSALQVLQKHGVNYIRLRVWNDPTDAFGDPVGGGNTDLASAIATAKAAKQLGMGVLLDFHYSDFWADPGTQVKPKAWTNHTGETLQQDVYSFTYDSLQAMKQAGALPDMVQIGNEINSGMLHPDGGSATKAAPFLQKASAATRAVDAGIKIMIHLAGNSGGSASGFTGSFDTWTSGTTAVDFDIIGISDYPFWHGTMAQNKTILQTLAAKYGKQVVVAETSYGWTLDEGDEQLNTFSQAQATDSGYTPTVQGQAAEVRDIIANVAGVPDDKGLGVFYWGAVWLPGVDTGWITGQGSGWENQALFDYTGKALPSLDVFSRVRDSAAPPAAVLTDADTIYAKAVAGGTLSLGTTAAGRYSDGYYRAATVASWDTSAVDLTKEGVYRAYGTIAGTDVKATAVVTVGPAQPANLIPSNAGFESGTSATGWTVESPLAVKNNKSDAHAGSYALHFSASQTAKKAYRTLTGVANGTYTFSIWAEAYGTTSADISIYAEGYDSADAAKQVKAAVATGSWGQWKQYSVAVPVTSGTVTIGVSVQGASGLYGDFDDAYFGLPAVQGDGSAKTAPVLASRTGGEALASGSAVPGGQPGIVLTSATPGARIYYTTDGDTPAYASGSSTTQYYAGPIALAGNATVKAIAVAPGYEASDIASLELKADYAQGGSSSSLANGEFDTIGELDGWELEGAEKGELSSSTFDVNAAGPFAGAGAFNYYAADAYAFKLSKKLTGLQPGVYKLTAYSSGQSNRLTGTDGRYAADTAVASLSLSARTQSESRAAAVINQGWSVWRGTAIAGLNVTDGTLGIAFGGTAAAGYWGYVDHVVLERTGDYAAGTVAGRVVDNAGLGVPGASVTISVGDAVYGTATADETGAYAISGVLANTGAMYTVRAAQAGYTGASIADVAVEKGAETRLADLVLEGVPAVTDITLTSDAAEASIAVGESFRLTAALSPADATIKSVVFASGDDNIASVSDVVYDAAKGTTSAKITGLRAGDGIVTATARDGGAKAEYRFVVKEATDPGTDPGNGDDEAPGKVSAVSVAAADGKLILTWDDPADADLAYIRIAGESEGGQPIAGRQVDAGVHRAELDGLTNGVSYSVTLTAVDAAGHESEAVTVNGTPTAPYIPNPPSTSTPVIDPSKPVVDSRGLTVEASADTSGLASVTLGAADIESAIKALAGSELRIAVKPDAATSGVRVTLPSDALLAASTAGKLSSIVIDNGLAPVTIDAQWLATQAKAGETVTLTVAKADTSKLPQATLDQLAGHPVYDFKLEVGGRHVEQFGKGGVVHVAVPYTLGAGRQAGQVVVYAIDGEGRLTPVVNSRYDAATGTVRFAPAHFSLYAAASAKTLFTDLQQHAWAAPAVEALAARGAVRGDGNGTFRPNGIVTRAEFVTMLANAFELASGAGSDAPAFTDVAAGQWYTDAVASAAKLGIVTGRPDGAFGLDAPITRQEMAAMLYRAANAVKLDLAAAPAVQAAAFTDADAIAPYARDAAAAMQRAGILQGTGAGAFTPAASATRAQAATAIYRLFEQQ
ncbi:glycosyl hydrolase 53 family protein [Cohnella sp. 56]|uniref:glycosyl hydrolase 53 family protein n=1 Tax=Cohnella sp. 56 TaxID=3113722 RepID=UPI0030E7B482